MHPTLQLVAAPAALPAMVAAAAIFILGVVVVARERAGTVTLSFFSLTLAVSLWLASISVMLAVTNPVNAFLFARIAYVGVALIPAAVLQFTFALLGMAGIRKLALVGVWTLSTLFAFGFTSSHRMLAGTWHYPWGFYPLLTPSSIVFLVFFGAVLLSSLVLLATSPANSQQERLRNRAFLFALALGYFGCVDFIPSFGVPLYPLGSVAILGFIALSVRSIVRFRLTDLSPAFVAERLLQTMPGGVIVVDMAGSVRVANEVAASLLGWPVAAMRGVDLCALLGVPVLPVTDTDSFCRRSMTRNRIVQWKRRDGSELELSLSASGLCDAAGNSVGVLYALADVSDRR
ncbi:MAG: histidine kinase N-terminal 7TM domain-containing protein, partial [Thermoanaerobaculia bacterium]